MNAAQQAGKVTVPPVTIEVIPSLELVTAAASLSQLGKLGREKSPFLPHEADEIHQWHESVEEDLSPFEQSDLDLAFSTVTTIVFLMHMAVRKGYRTPEEIITAVREMGDAQFVDAYRETLAVEPGHPNWLQTEIIAEALETDRDRESVPFSEEAAMLVRLLSSPEQYRLKIASVLEWFNRKYVVPKSDRISAVIAARRLELESLILRDPTEWLNRLSGGNYETLLAERSFIVILPIYFASLERTMLLPDEAYLIIGATRLARALAPPDDTEAIRATTDDLLRSIADPTRLTILRLLKERTRYGKELSDELGIAAPTISYHIDKLLQAGLARLELSQGRRFYYAVNPDGIRLLQDHLEKEFLT